MRRILSSLFLGVCIFLLAGEAYLLFATDQPFLTGLRPPSAAESTLLPERSRQYTIPKSPRAALPASVTNIAYLPVVNRQTLPNCGAYAPTYYLKTYLEARKRGWGRVNPSTHPERATSPGIAYVFGQSSPQGGSITGSIEVMRAVGALPLSRLPDSYNYDRTQYPPARLLLEAMPYRGGDLVTFEAKTEEGFLAVKEWLALSEIAVFGLPISQAMFDYGPGGVSDAHNEVIYGLGGPYMDRHAFTLIGYDDAKTYTDARGPQQGAFLAVNSWGVDWGVAIPEAGTRGFLWIGYDYFRSQAFSIASMTLAEEPVPTHVGLFAYDHPYSTQVQMDFWAGDHDEPDVANEWVRINPGTNTAYRPDQPLVINLTDPSGLPSEAFWWRVFNIGAISGLPHPTHKGTAHDFRVYRYDDLLTALPGQFFHHIHGNTNFTWLHTPIERIDAPHLAARGLPKESELLPRYIDIAVGMMDEGEEILTDPVIYGSVLFVDLNRDELPDLLVIGGGPTQVYANMGGSFRLVDGHGLPDVGNGAAAAGDMDRDGLPDIALCGGTETGPRTSVFRNLGDFQFQDIQAGLPGVGGRQMTLGASMAWGDYDNDGLEDLAFWGFTASGSKHVQVYRNRGDGAFEPAVFQLPEYHGAQVAWHDVNADGLLDLVVNGHAFVNLGNGRLGTEPLGNMGEDDVSLGAGLWADFTGNGLPDLVQNESLWAESGSSSWLRVYRNLGDGSLADTGIRLADIGNARMVAADLTNSGNLDLVSTHTTGNFGGMSMNTPRATAVFRQMPDGSFRNAGFDLLAVTEGAVAVADIDADGDLDVVTSGYLQGGFEKAAHLHRGLLAQSPWGSRANTRPTPPVSLAAAHDAQSRSTRFTWQHGTDAETPQAALTYNVRIGRWPGEGDVLSPASSAPMTSTTRTYRLSADQPGLLLRDLGAGFYYWSVRSVDAGHLASEWSPLQVLALRDGLDPRDVNGDGRFDVADLVFLARLLEDAREHLPMDYDFNADGLLNQADVRTLANRLAGSADNVPGSYTIGSVGGSISQDGLALNVPAGAISDDQPISVTIEKVSVLEAFAKEQAPFGYQITGLPLNTSTPLEIVLENTFAGQPRPLVFIGENGFARGAPESGWHYRVVRPDVRPDGRLRIVIPQMTASSPTRTAKSDAESAYALNVGVLGGYALYEGPLFAIAFPTRYAGDPIENLMSGFEQAYRLLRDDYGFSYARRTRWPVDVNIRDLGQTDGESSASAWGNNYGTIAINSRIIEDLQRGRVTAAHEFFHLVQGLYDPRSAWAQSSRASRHYWLDEAMSTWFEALVVSNPGSYFPPNYYQYLNSPYRGVASGITGDAKQWADYGYGMAPLIKYLVEREGPQALLNVYTAIKQGRDSVTALETAVPRTPLFVWYSDFFTKLIANATYAIDWATLSQVIPRSQRFVVSKEKPDSCKLFPVRIPDLAGALHLFGFTEDAPEPPADALFAVRHEGEADLSLQIFQGSNTEDPQQLVQDIDVNAVKFAVVAGAQAYKINKRRLLALVANTNASAPYTRERQGTLAMGIVRPSLPVQANTVAAQNYGRAFPVFAGQGTLDGQALSDLQDTPGSALHQIQARAWGGDTIDLVITYKADIASLEETWTQGNATHTLRTPGIATYKIIKGDGEGNELMSFASTDGRFPVTLDRSDRDRGFAMFEVHAVYPLTYEQEGFSPSTQDAEWPLAVFVFQQNCD